MNKHHYLQQIIDYLISKIKIKEVIETIKKVTSVLISIHENKLSLNNIKIIIKKY